MEILFLRYEVPNAGGPSATSCRRTQNRKNTDPVTASPTLCASNQLLGVKDTCSCTRLAIFVVGAELVNAQACRLMLLVVSYGPTVRRMATSAAHYHTYVHSSTVTATTTTTPLQHDTTAVLRLYEGGAWWELSAVVEVPPTLVDRAFWRPSWQIIHVCAARCGSIKMCPADVLAFFIIKPRGYISYVAGSRSSTTNNSSSNDSNGYTQAQETLLRVYTRSILRYTTYLFSKPILHPDDCSVDSGHWAHTCTHA